MKKIFLVIIMLLAATTAWAVADPAAEQHRQFADQLLKALKIEQHMNKSMAEMKEQQREMLKNMPLDNQNPQSKEESERMMAKMMESMSWEKIKGDYIDALVETFTPEELKGTAEFLESPVGTAVIDKFPALINRVMMAGMKESDVEGWQARSRSYGQGEQKGMLRTLSTAAETFATANSGKYPADMSKLTGARPPYMIKNYCDVEVSGYRFTCDMSETGYSFSAVPVGETSDSLAVFTIKTGGILTETKPESIQEGEVGVIKLKSGETIKGKIIERNSKFIKVDQGIGVEITYYLDEIESLGNETAPVKK